MNITADAVKQLRERTGAGMMECKKALVETKGDLDAAAELMRKQGLAKADKKATRIAAEGVVVHRQVRRRPHGRDGRGQLRDRLRRARARTSGPSRRPWPRSALGSRPASLDGARRGEARERRERRGAPPRAGRQDRREHQRAPLRRAVARPDSSAPTCTARASARWWRSRAARRHSRTIWPCTWPPATRATCRTAQVPAEVVAKEREHPDRAGAGRGQAAGDRRQDGRGPPAQVAGRDHARRASRS